MYDNGIACMNHILQYILTKNYNANVLICERIVHLTTQPGLKIKKDFFKTGGTIQFLGDS